MAPLFNECFEQTSYNLDLAQYNFMGMMLTAIAYGIHTLLLLTCIRPVYRRGIPLLSYVVAVFSLATVEFALQVWWYETVVIKGQFQHDEHRTLVQHHPHHTISLARTVVYIIMNWFSEGILLYRFYVIFHLIGGHAILFGVISFLVLSTLVVTGGICIPAITGLGFTWLPDICTSPGIAYLCLSISAHVILTSLIVVRLTLLRRKLLRTFGTDHGKVYISLVVILIESASLYTIWALTSLILYGKDSPGQFIVLPAQGQIQAICPLLIINWVVSGHALSRDTFSSSPSTLRLQSSIVFNDPEDILLPYPKPAYLSPTRSISKLPDFTTSSRDSLWTSENKDPLTRGSL